MTKERLECKVKKLEDELNTTKDKLEKMTPLKPIIDDERKYDSNKHELIHKFTYFCGYCGEQVRVNSKKHKCGQIQDWNFSN